MGAQELCPKLVASRVAAFVMWWKNVLMKQRSGDGDGRPFAIKKAGVEWIDACFDVCLITLR
jgi:hypothetical protein